MPRYYRNKLFDELKSIEYAEKIKSKYPPTQLQWELDTLIEQKNAMGLDDDDPEFLVMFKSFLESHLHINNYSKYINDTIQQENTTNNYLECHNLVHSNYVGNLDNR